MLLINSDESKLQNMTEEESQSFTADYFAFTQKLNEAGAMLGGDPLYPSATAKTVSKGGVVTDGPFADITEHLGGFYMIDVGSIDDAVKWASQLPGVERGFDRIEVREVRELPNM
jgi:hypothetical protein